MSKSMGRAVGDVVIRTPASVASKGSSSSTRIPSRKQSMLTYMKKDLNLSRRKLQFGDGKPLLATSNQKMATECMIYQEKASAEPSTCGCEVSASEPPGNCTFVNICQEDTWPCRLRMAWRRVSYWLLRMVEVVLVVLSYASIISLTASIVDPFQSSTDHEKEPGGSNYDEEDVESIEQPNTMIMAIFRPQNSSAMADNSRSLNFFEILVMAFKKLFVFFDFLLEVD